MLIRPYRESDVDAVASLWSDCELTAPQNNPLLDIERKLKVNPEWFLVGEIEGTIIASCMAGYEGHRGWINYLAVAPSEQRKGHAAKIMGEVERLLRDAGCPKINLQVRTTNEKVVEFYRSIGFTIDEVTSMGKRLQSDKLPR